MKNSRLMESQVVAILKEAGAGRLGAELIRKHAVDRQCGEYEE